MKLRNKKTGDIGVLNIFDGYQVVAADEPLCGNSVLGEYDTLAELNEEWQDYEEPKKYWYLSASGTISWMEYDGDEFDSWCKEIGNYFETEEEAEQAVEKLKAWKRLKEKGFKFTGIYEESSIDFIVNDLSSQTESDLTLLFGGEE